MKTNNNNFNISPFILSGTWDLHWVRYNKLIRSEAKKVAELKPERLSEDLEEIAQHNSFALIETEIENNNNPRTLK